MSTTGYVYDGGRRLLELDVDTRVARFDYLDGPTGELAAVESTWLLNDPSGSASTLARYDAAGHWLASHRDYDAFGDSRGWGVSLVDADTDVTDAEDRRVLGNEADFFAGFPRVYQGGYWDEGAQLYQLGGSWYDPLTGRFAQDRGGPFSSNQNGYAFAGEAPNRARLVGATDESFSLDERTGLYGAGVVGTINYGVGEGLRTTLGDEYVAGASLLELQGVLFAGGVVGAVAGLEVATLATAYSLGTVGAAVLAGGAGGAAEYLGTTLTASAFNSALGRGGDPGPTLGGLAVATAGGALTGGLVAGVTPLAVAGARGAVGATQAFVYDVAAPFAQGFGQGLASASRGTLHGFADPFSPFVYLIHAAARGGVQNVARQADILEQAAQAYSRDYLGETILRTQFRQGAALRGLDFGSFSGTGTSAGLILNEVKNVTGSVRGSKITSLGLGRSGEATFTTNLGVLARAINEAGLDRATTKALLNQLENQTYAVRLIGNANKGTFFSESVVERIRHATSARAVEYFNL